MYSVAINPYPNYNGDSFDPIVDLREIHRSYEGHNKPVERTLDYHDTWITHMRPTIIESTDPDHSNEFTLIDNAQGEFLWPVDGDVVNRKRVIPKHVGGAVSSQELLPKFNSQFIAPMRYIDIDRKTGRKTINTKILSNY